jgi:SAM-dependent methyltransferase
MAYDEAFFASMHEAAYRSAERVLPQIWHRRPNSIVDVGCGVGSWLKAAMDKGVVDIVGIDNWAPWDRLVIPKDKLVRQDLTLKFEMHRTFDMALCLEVAEHLPEACAGGLVESLCKLAPVIAFSAAIPGQGGEGHVNEQWPQYWMTKFAQCGFIAQEVRDAIWTMDDVSWWYKQNLFVFQRVDDYKPELLEHVHHAARVHPVLWQKMLAEQA